MTIYAWPNERPYIPATSRLKQIHNNQAFTSLLSGYTQTSSLPGARWGWGLDWPANEPGDRASFEGQLTRLSGMEHRTSLWDFKRPRPRGTCNLSGVTVQSTAAQFTTSIVLAGCGNAKTLLAGDWVGLPGGQLVMVVADAQASSGGSMTIEVRHPLRSQVSAGGAVTLDRPTALFILTDSTFELPRQPGFGQPGFSLEFVEVFA